MNKKVLSELGDYLLAHREEIIGEWLQRLNRTLTLALRPSKG